MHLKLTDGFTPEQRQRCVWPIHFLKKQLKKIEANEK